MFRISKNPNFALKLLHLKHLSFMKAVNLLFFLWVLAISAHAQTVNISIDVTQNRKPVSLGIYGINNALSDDPSNPSPLDPVNSSATTWQRFKDAGIKLFRDNNGNNATKYNWRLKLTSAPDWYNNVYHADWDFKAKNLQTNIPGAQGLFAFQLIGKAASSDQHNFDDWDYNGAQWWDGVSNNWAGGGGPTSVGGNGGVGDPNLYLENWPADSTVGILDKWFGTGGLGINKNTFPYWNMDNEPEIWYSTHDDVMPKQLSAENFMQNYFKVAKAARAKFPTIKLVGFVPCGEWFWYAYDDGSGSGTSGLITSGGKQYSWIEFFIKRISEEQKATGIRLLDVVDLHTYLSAASEAELLQVHRVFYDKTFDYPGANGLHLIDNTDNEYIFARINAWLDQYLGIGHGVTIGSTESGWDAGSGFKQMPQALSYASILGVFANNGVEVFTPWYWSPSYWEVVHLFSRYSKNISVLSTSSDDNNLSAYATTNTNNDSLTVVMVNRYNSSKNVNVLPTGTNVPDGTYDVLTLSNLPADNTTITFVSHTQNALKKNSVTVSGGGFTLSLPANSLTSVILKCASGPYLNVSSSSLNVAATANSTAAVTVSSNAGAWTATSDQTWLSVSPGGTNNGSITVTATTANTSTTTTRVAHLTVTNGTITKTITITQLAQPTLSLNPTSVSIAAPASSTGTFAITSNTDWTVSSNQTWLSVNLSTGSGNGTVTVTANSNNPSSSVTRSAMVTVTVSGIAAQTITVTQAASTAVTGVTVAPISITITGSNQQLTATVSPASATDQNVTWSSSNQSIAAVNDNGLVVGIAAGNAVITVTTEDGKKTATSNVTVTTPSVTNLITNPGFENGTTGWDVGNSFSVSTADKHAGNQSMLVTGGCPANYGCWTNLFQTVTVTPNTDYLLTFWIKGAASPTTVSAIVSEANWGPQLVQKNITPTTSWVMQSMTFNSGSNSQIMVIFQDGMGGTSYIDDVQLFALSGPASPASLSATPTTISLPATAGTSNITVTSNIAWTAVSDQTAWLTVAPASGSGNGTVVATALANSTTSARTAHVTLSGTGVTSQTVTINQAAAAANITVSATAVNVNAAINSTGSFTVTSNIAWSITGNPAWLTVSPTSGTAGGPTTLTVTANTENTNTTTRSATLTVSGTGATSKTVTVTQAGTGSSLLATPLTWSAVAAGGTQAITVTSNITWTVAKDQTWLSVSVPSGSNNGSLTITAAANTSAAARTGHVTISGTGVTTQTVNITQAAATASLSATPLAWSPTAIGGTQDITVTSNISWNVAKDQTWLSISATSGVNNGVLTITADANTATIARTGHITISGTGCHYTNYSHNTGCNCNELIGFSGIFKCSFFCSHSFFLCNLQC
jgi:hypothetical protein